MGFEPCLFSSPHASGRSGLDEMSQVVWRQGNPVAVPRDGVPRPVDEMARRSRNAACSFSTFGRVGRLKSQSPRLSSLPAIVPAVHPAQPRHGGRGHGGHGQNASVFRPGRLARRLPPRRSARAESGSFSLQAMSPSGLFRQTPESVDDAGKHAECTIESNAWGDLYRPGVEVRDGQVATADGPGWGVAINPDWRAKAQHQESKRGG